MPFHPWSLPLAAALAIATATTTAAADVEPTPEGRPPSLFPFGGPFFIGAKLGRQHLAASTALTLASYGSYSEALTFDEWFVDPRLGLLWTAGFGLTLGFDVGVQIPIGSTSSSTLPTGVMASAEATSVASRFGAGVLPTVDLVRLGFLF